jgi:uncharacterized protein
MRPEFKQKHYHASILAGITAIQKAIDGTYVVPKDEVTEIDPNIFFWIVIIVAALVTFLVGLIQPLVGGVTGIFLGFCFPWFILDSLGIAIILGIVGFIIGIASRAIAESSGGSGDWSGGGGGGFDSSSSSFSGGGGDSGGGGASGSLD